MVAAMSILYRGDLRDHLESPCAGCGLTPQTCVCGLYTVRMDKHRATWNYFTTNPQGGGFGSNHCGSKRVALAYATRALTPGTRYRLLVNGKDCGIQTQGGAA
jgi:hypothetical protein